ncbi:MAG: hypothetical protein ACNA8W_10945 [Bradymonadaceae bacterium]
MKNILKIRAHALDLELSGDAAYVEDAYDAIRLVVMDRFERSLLKEASEASEVSEVEEELRKRSDTSPMYKAAIKQAAEAGLPETTDAAADTPLHTVVVGDVYHNIGIIARGEFDKSIFGNVVSARKVERIFIDEIDEERLAKHFTFGKILWRELTSAGQSVIAGGKREK